MGGGGALGFSCAQVSPQRNRALSLESGQQRRWYRFRFSLATQRKLKKSAGKDGEEKGTTPRTPPPSSPFFVGPGRARCCRYSDIWPETLTPTRSRLRPNPGPAPPEAKLRVTSGRTKPPPCHPAHIYAGVLEHTSPF